MGQMKLHLNVITFDPFGFKGSQFYKCNYICPNVITFGVNVITFNLSGFTASSDNLSCLSTHTKRLFFVDIDVSKIKAWVSN